jgi:hypothetical protein
MTFTVEHELDDLVCCECSMVFAAPSRYIADRRRDHAWFYCPKGHPQHFSGETSEEKIRRERDRLKQKLAEKDDDIAAAIKARDDAMTGWRAANETALSERRRANGYKGHAAKITRRAKAGTCPCCNRTFRQLARHMATQHPQFTPIAIGQEPDPERTMQ